MIGLLPTIRREGEDDPNDGNVGVNVLAGKRSSGN